MEEKTFLKTGPVRALEFEKAGIQWLAQATAKGGVPMVPVLGLDRRGLLLARLSDGYPTPQAARQFGARLAHTHAAGAPYWAAAPDGYTHSVANKGQMPMSVRPRHWLETQCKQDKHEKQGTQEKQDKTGLIQRFKSQEELREESWGQWYSNERLIPCLELASKRGILKEKQRNILQQAIENISGGMFDSPQPSLVKTPAARCHGDLWAGNLMWGPDGVVLIDPAAHGGHAETDLAECSMFGTPFMNHIYAGYEEYSLLATGWQDRIAMHQLYMLTLHLALFGGAYLSPTLEAAYPYR